MGYYFEVFKPLLLFCISSFSLLPWKPAVKFGLCFCRGLWLREEQTSFAYLPGFGSRGGEGVGRNSTETTYGPVNQKKKAFSKTSERFPRTGKREREGNRELESPERKEHALNLSTSIHPIPVYTMHCPKSTE